MTLNPKPFILLGFRVFYFAVDTKIDTASREALFTYEVFSLQKEQPPRKFPTAVLLPASDVYSFSEVIGSDDA